MYLKSTQYRSDYVELHWGLRGFPIVPALSDVLHDEEPVSAVAELVWAPEN